MLKSEGESWIEFTFVIVCDFSAARVVGQLGKLRPIVNRPTAAFAPDSGGSQPPRWLPACPTGYAPVIFSVIA
jgi:hypothetical protein